MKIDCLSILVYWMYSFTLENLDIASELPLIWTKIRGTIVSICSSVFARTSK